MSWSGFGQASEHGITVTSLTLSPPYEGAADEVREQMELAADVATTIVRSGACGGPESKSFSVSVSGHANPGHTPAEGMANDVVTVSVGQRSEG